MLNTQFQSIKTTLTISKCSVDCGLTIISFIKNEGKNLVSFLHKVNHLNLNILTVLNTRML